MRYEDVLNQLQSMGDPKNIQGMGRFGIKTENNYGNSVTTLRNYAKKIGKNHDLALKLWKTGIRDARMVAACIEDPSKTSEEQIDQWVKDIDSWDICDHCCGHFFDKTPFAYKKVREWTKSNELFIKRAGFSLIAWLAVHDKKKSDKEFEELLKIIKKESIDERNYVKKAVNWALRQIGKRNWNMNKEAIAIAKEIKKIDSKSAKWIASDAIRELTSEKVRQRLDRKKN
ncbi:DNA alkylation repair protein [Thermoplasmatales archaeon SG8-52-4]|nr:MAG: DNA alkylation repair protein [Thermoplasmatales archaeon SG8-52-4]